MHNINPNALHIRKAQESCELVVNSDAISLTLVEPDGFEPTTSCLQSTRSTN